MYMKTRFIIAISALYALTACNGNQGQMPPQVLGIPVVEVVERDVTGFDVYPANIEGKVNNSVRAKISGYIQEVYIDEGQKVTKGQPLFRLETDVQSQDANAARAAIGAAEANISAAEAAVNAAQVEVNKLIPLVEKNIISSVQLETAKANLLRAQGQLEQAKATRQQAQATLGGVQANIDFSIVRSPITGIVGPINFREGSLVSPADPLPITTVSEISEVYAYFSMNEGEYLDFIQNAKGETLKEKIENIDEVELQLANGAIFPEKGKIQTVTGQIDPMTGSIQFRVVFNNSAGILNNGNSGLIRVPVQYNNALVIPENATFERQGITYVYKVKNDSVFTTPIQLIDRFDNMAIVQSGLEKNDVVAAQGIGKLRNQFPIQPQKTDLDAILESVKPVM